MIVETTTAGILESLAVAEKEGIGPDVKPRHFAIDIALLGNYYFVC
jgi:hypothetical protein